MAAILKVWRQVEIPTRLSMRIYLKNIPAKFHPEPIWSDGALGFFEEDHPNKKLSSDMRPVRDPKTLKEQKVSVLLFNLISLLKCTCSYIFLLPVCQIFDKVSYRYITIKLRKCRKRVSFWQCAKCFVSVLWYKYTTTVGPKGQNPLHQFPRSKSATSLQLPHLRWIKLRGNVSSGF